MESSTLFRSARLNWGYFLIQWVTFTFAAILIAAALTTSNALSYLEKIIPGFSYASTDPVVILVSRLIEGLLIGAAQWVALRQYVKPAGRWLWGALAGYGLSAVVSIAVIVTRFSLATLILGEYSPDDTARFFFALLLANLDIWIPAALVQVGVLYLWVGRRGWWWLPVFTLAGWLQLIFIALPAKSSLGWAGYMSTAILTAAGMVFVLTGRLGQRRPAISTGAGKPPAGGRHRPVEPRKGK
jgi:hypothetical protein